MKRRETKSESGPISIEVDSTLHLGQFDGWQLLSYDTDPAAGFLFRDAGQTSDRLEIFYWQQEGGQNKPQFVLEAETGNLGIGAATPTDKLTIRGGALAFQPPAQDQSEMGIDYDAASQSLRIRARKGNATGLDKDVLTINKDGEVAAGAVKANSLQANGANQSLTIASAGTGALLLNPAGGNVGIGRTQPKARLDIATPEGLTGSLLRFSPQYGDGESYYLDVRADTEQGVIRYNYDVMNNGKLFANNLVLQSGNVGIGVIPAGARLEVNGTVKATAFAGSGAQLAGIKAASISEGVLAVERIPSLPADRIPQLDQLNGQLPVAKLSGTLPLDRTSGNLSTDRVLGNLPIDRITGNLPIANTTGKLPAARVEGVFSQWTTSGAAISYTGKVSIGTTQVDATLNVGGPVKIDGSLTLNAEQKILLKGGDANHGIQHLGDKKFAEQKVDGPIIFGWGGGALGSRDGSKEVIALAWNQKGHIGIGTTNPDGRLEIKGTEENATIKFGGKNGDVHHLSSARDMVFNSVNGDFYFRKLTNFNDLKTYGESNLMSINPDGDVAIKGSISCGGKVALKTYHNTYLCAQEKNRVTQAPKPSAYEQFTLEMACSREFKENIAELSAAEALATLQDLNPVKYDYKDEHAFRQNLGFIAEEMPANLASEDRKSISPFEVIPVLTRVVKEQQQTIAALQETMRALQRDVRQPDCTGPKG